MSVLAENMDRLIKEKKLSYIRLAQVAGVADKTPANLIHGHHEPIVSKVIAIAIALDILGLGLEEPWQLLVPEIWRLPVPDRRKLVELVTLFVRDEGAREMMRGYLGVFTRQLEAMQQKDATPLQRALPRDHR